MPKRKVLKRRPLSNYKKYTLAELLERYDPNAPKDPVLLDWDNAPPVGKEFGSPEWDRLISESKRT